MRPLVFVNVAASVDGRITDWSRKQIRISCEEDMKRVDSLRAESDAVLVGIGTVLSDNPSLTIKSSELREIRTKAGKSPNPLRIVLDSKARTPLNAKVLSKDAKTLIVVSEAAEEERVEELRRRVEVAVLGKEKVDLNLLMKYLWKRGIERLMVEGGGKIISSFLREGLVDYLYVYIGGVVFGEGVSLAEGRIFPHAKLELLDVRKLGKGVLSEWKVLKVEEACNEQQS